MCVEWRLVALPMFHVIVASDPVKAAVDQAANALQAALLLATKLEEDHAELRRAIDRAARALATLKPGGTNGREEDR
jgi:hypothetical protein